MTLIRRALIAAAIVCFSGAVALTPAEVRSRIASASRPMDQRTAPPPQLPAAVPPDGDPFVARVPDDDAPAAAVPAELPLGDLPRLGPLPANAGASSALFGRMLRRGAVVRAIVLWPHPTALVDDGAGTRTCAPGDALDGSRVKVVDAGGVTLTDGRRLTLVTAPADAP